MVIFVLLTIYDYTGITTYGGLYLLVLLYMIIPITKWTLSLNSHQKKNSEHMRHLFVCLYYHMWPL